VGRGMYFRIAEEIVASRADVTQRSPSDCGTGPASLLTFYTCWYSRHHGQTNRSGGGVRHRRKVLVVDADPQSTATYWRSLQSDRASHFQVIAQPSAVLHKELPALARNGRL
jgi:hypothetical protein